VPTVSRKSERLVNLTIALLATGRWITKSEIYENIEGYSGEPDAKERMFERDKEELRNLGIDIEVGTFDPLFEDEVGYRIRPENYRIQISELTPQQLALISSATQSWRGAILDSKASAGLAKLKALGIESDVDGIPINPHQVTNSDTNLVKVIDALASHKTISFDYRAADNNDENRALDPYGVGTKNGFWYVAGNDLERKAVRLFRLDRVVSEVKEQGRGSSYEIPENFSMHEQLQARTRKHVAQLLVRKGKAHQLRKHAQIDASQDEWDQLQYHYSDVKELVRDLLWHRDDVKVIEPTEVRESLLAALSSIQGRHE
jgi:proteasome accessory factor B